MLFSVNLYSSSPFFDSTSLENLGVCMTLSFDRTHLESDFQSHVALNRILYATQLYVTFIILITNTRPHSSVECLAFGTFALAPPIRHLVCI